MASGRRLIIDKLNQEAAWNYGASFAFLIPLAQKMLKLNAEYYYTDFLSQTVIDYDTNPQEIHVTNLMVKATRIRSRLMRLIRSSRALN